MVRTWKPIVGGILSIAGGAIHVLGWLFVAVVLRRIISGSDFDIGFSATAIIWVIIFPLIILAIVAIIGGIFSLYRRSWGLALVGGICAIFSPLTWYLGLLAVIFVAISKDEFRSKEIHQ